MLILFLFFSLPICRNPNFYYRATNNQRTALAVLLLLKKHRIIRTPSSPKGLKRFAPAETAESVQTDAQTGVQNPLCSTNNPRTALAVLLLLKKHRIIRTPSSPKGLKRFAPEETTESVQTDAQTGVQNPRRSLSYAREEIYP